MTTLHCTKEQAYSNRLVLQTLQNILFVVKIRYNRRLFTKIVANFGIGYIYHLVETIKQYKNC